jgi:hypothetical protein
MRWILLPLLLAACQLDEPIPPVDQAPVQTGEPRRNASGLSEAERMLQEQVGVRHMGEPTPQERQPAREGAPPAPQPAPAPQTAPPPPAQ